MLSHSESKSSSTCSIYNYISQESLIKLKFTAKNSIGAFVITAATGYLLEMAEEWMRNKIARSSTDWEEFAENDWTWITPLCCGAIAAVWAGRQGYKEAVRAITPALENGTFGDQLSVEAKSTLPAVTASNGPSTDNPSIQSDHTINETDSADFRYTTLRDEEKKPVKEGFFSSCCSWLWSSSKPNKPAEDKIRKDENQEQSVIVHPDDKDIEAGYDSEDAASDSLLRQTDDNGAIPVRSPAPKK